MLNAFKMADEVLLQGVQGITDLITTPGLINTDFADVKMILTNAGSALMGVGYASGDGRAVTAARAAISSPLLEASIEGARGILLNVSGPSDLGLFELNEAAEIIGQAAHPDANIIFGAVIDDALGDEVRITVIAAGFDRFEGEQRRARAPSSELARSRRRGLARRRGRARPRRRRLRRPRIPALTLRARRGSRSARPASGAATGAVASRRRRTTSCNVGDHVGDDPAVGRRATGRAIAAAAGLSEPERVGVAAPGARRRRARRRRTDRRRRRPRPTRRSPTTPGLPLAIVTADCAPIVARVRRRGRRRARRAPRPRARRDRGARSRSCARSGTATGARVPRSVHPRRRATSSARADLARLVAQFGPEVVGPHRATGSPRSTSRPRSASRSSARGVDDVRRLRRVHGRRRADHFSYRRDGATGRQVDDRGAAVSTDESVAERRVGCERARAHRGRGARRRARPGRGHARRGVEGGRRRRGRAPRSPPVSATSARTAPRSCVAKAEALATPCSRAPVWHFIGRLQRNKVRAVAPYVALWQSVDRRRARRRDRAPRARARGARAGERGRRGRRRAAARPRTRRALVDALRGARASTSRDS